MEIIFTSGHFLILFQRWYLFLILLYCSYCVKSIYKRFIDECWAVKKIVKKRCNNSLSVSLTTASPHNLAHRNHDLNPHFLGFIFKYCLIEEGPLNFLICSSILENNACNDSVKLSMIGVILQSLFCLVLYYQHNEGFIILHGFLFS